jgi:hypothetical protein
VSKPQYIALSPDARQRPGVVIAATVALYLSAAFSLAVTLLRHSGGGGFLRVAILAFIAWGVSHGANAYRIGAWIMGAFAAALLVWALVTVGTVVGDQPSAMDATLRLVGVAMTLADDVALLTAGVLLLTPPAHDFFRARRAAATT